MEVTETSEAFDVTQLERMRLPIAPLNCRFAEAMCNSIASAVGMLIFADLVLLP